jgi:hypothetical protein
MEISIALSIYGFALKQFVANRDYIKWHNIGDRDHVHRLKRSVAEIDEADRAEPTKSQRPPSIWLNATATGRVLTSNMAVAASAV